MSMAVAFQMLGMNQAKSTVHVHTSVIRIPFWNYRGAVEPSVLHTTDGETLGGIVGVAEHSAVAR